MTYGTLRLFFAVPIALMAVTSCTQADRGTGNYPERGPIAKSDVAGSCSDGEGVTYCGGRSAGACWCDNLCDGFGDCCTDRDTLCNDESPCSLIDCESGYHCTTSSDGETECVPDTGTDCNYSWDGDDCPSSWFGTNDGCDCKCGNWTDPDPDCGEDEDPCDLVDCAPGQHCTTGNDGEAECVPDLDEDPCNLVDCAPEWHCETNETGDAQCVFPCYPAIEIECATGFHCVTIGSGSMCFPD